MIDVEVLFKGMRVSDFVTLKREEYPEVPEKDFRPARAAHEV